MATRPMNAQTVIKKPWLSERALMLGAQNKFVFLVGNEATKPSVRDEVQRRFGVTVTAVNMVKKEGKMKRFRYVKNRRTGMKKAIVTLKAGDKIEIQ